MSTIPVSYTHLDVYKRQGDYDALLKLGPNIKDWPEIAPLGDNLLLKVASYITDPCLLYTSRCV